MKRRSRFGEITGHDGVKYTVDFLLTWNCRHIANPVIQEKIAAYLEQQDLFLPIICTPEELLGGEVDE